MRIRDLLIERIESFLVENDMSARRFGLAAAGDHKLLSRLRSGHGHTLVTVDRIECYMEAYPAATERIAA